MSMRAWAASRTVSGRWLICGVALGCALAGIGAEAQTKKATTPKRSTVPPPAQTVKAAPDVICPTILGDGVTSKRTYCDVMKIGRAHV